MPEHPPTNAVTFVAKPDEDALCQWIAARALEDLNEQGLFAWEHSGQPIAIRSTGTSYSRSPGTGFRNGPARIKGSRLIVLIERRLKPSQPT